MMNTSSLHLRKLAEAQMKAKEADVILEEDELNEEKSASSEIECLADQFNASSRADDGFIRGTSSISSRDTLENDEIFQDALSMMNHGSDVSSKSMIQALASFSDCSLPKFEKGKSIYKCPVLFTNLYLPKLAEQELNDKYGFHISWDGGFLIGRKVPIYTFTYWKYKNKQKHYSSKVETFLKDREQKYMTGFRTAGKVYQLLNGRACIPVFPILDNMTFGKRFTWNFLGK
jgi:hypothetical protein